MWSVFSLSIIVHHENEGIPTHKPVDSQTFSANVQIGTCSRICHPQRIVLPPIATDSLSQSSVYFHCSDM